MPKAFIWAQACCTRERALSTFLVTVLPGVGRFGSKGAGMPRGELVGVSDRLQPGASISVLIMSRGANPFIIVIHQMHPA